MKITIHEEKNSHFTFHGKKKGPITSHENTLYHPHISEIEGKVAAQKLGIRPLNYMKEELFVIDIS